MILFHRVFQYLENWLLSNVKQLPHHFRCLLQETEIPAAGPFVWVGFPTAQILDHQVSQTWTCRSAQVPSRDELRTGLNLSAKTSAQVSGIQHRQTSHVPSSRLNRDCQIHSSVGPNLPQDLRRCNLR